MALPSKAVVGEELSWVSLPSRSSVVSSGVSCSPAGRSFHCAFFHGGACYVTGGSDGARKFGDMWRFCARESPPPLTTLAARAFFATKARREGWGSGGDGDGDGVSQGELLAGLPEELREALASLNMQAEVVL